MGDQSPSPDPRRAPSEGAVGISDARALVDSIAGGIERVAATQFIIEYVPGIHDLIVDGRINGIVRDIREQGYAIDQADGHHQACMIAAYLTNRDEPLPPSLQAYVVGAAQHGPKKKRGRNPFSNLCRDGTIVLAVELVCKHGNLHPTRSAVSADLERAESGCSIVAKALQQIGPEKLPRFRARTGKPLSERSIETIYRRYCALRERRFAIPGYP